MLRFVVRRLILLVPILLGLSILVFLWIRALPGSPATTLLGERATAEQIAAINEQYGLNEPIWEQYWSYLQQLGSLDFGDSLTTRRPVFDEFLERFPATIELAIGAMLFSIFVGIPLGFLAAKRYGSSLDHFSLFASLLGISIPIFVLAIILKYIFAVRLGWLPTVGRVSVLIELEHPTNFYILDSIITGNWAALWDCDQAPDPACDRARHDSARDHHPDHASSRARRAERGLRPHGPGEGRLAPHRRRAAHPP